MGLGRIFSRAFPKASGILQWVVLMLRTFSKEALMALCTWNHHVNPRIQWQISRGVLQGVGSAEADGGPSLEGFARPRSPRPSAPAVRHGREPSDLIATARWDADGIRRGRTWAVCPISGGCSPLSSSLQWVSLVLSAWHHMHPLRPYRDTNMLSFFVVVDILEVLSPQGFILNTFY
jgi:hypothetical protein